MPRPKRILWVDDEVETLTSHTMFLEQQGFTVDKAAHGDDALVLLQRQPYGVVLVAAASSCSRRSGESITPCRS
jgi:DNA-binding response OmpR family regulator